MSIWDILGISPTSDQKAIRRAYAEQLRHNNPEVNPEGFQKLREAYELALNGTSSTSVPERPKLPIKTPDLPPDPVEKINEKQIKALIMVDRFLAGSDLKEPLQDLEFSLLFQEALLDRFYTETPFPKKLFLKAYKIFNWRQLRLKSTLEEIVDEHNLHALLHYFEKGPLFIAAMLDDLELAKEALDSIEKRDEENSTPLHIACKLGSIAVATYLVEEGAELEAVNHLGKTPLMIAIENEELECIKMLTAAGANINHRDKSRYTPLYLAVATGCIAIILFFAHQSHIKFDPNALYYAVMDNNLALVKTLVESGADVSAPSSHNDNPLQCAARHDHFEILSYLLDHGADPNLAISIVAKRGFEKSFRRLIEAGANPFCNGGEPYLLAMQQGHHNILKFFDLEGINCPLIVGHLSKAGVYGFPSLIDDMCFRYESFYEMDENNKYVLNIRPVNDTVNPLFQAVLSNDRASLLQLLEEGNDPNQALRNGLGPLHVAIQHHYNDLFDLLLERGADINLALGPWPKLGYSPLFTAVKYQNTYAYKNLTERGALDNPTGSFHTALYPAVYNGNLDVVKDLIARGSNVNQFYWDGYRHLVYAAARYRCIDVLKYLISIGLQPDMFPQETPPPSYSACPHIQLTALTAAVKNNDLESVQVLLAAGANPNRQSEGVPPLHFASSEARFADSDTRDFDAIIASYHAIIDALLAAGADINGPSSTGETFLIKTIKTGEIETALHLIRAGADVNIPDHALTQNQTKILRALILGESYGK